MAKYIFSPKEIKTFIKLTFLVILVAIGCLFCKGNWWCLIWGCIGLFLAIIVASLVVFMMVMNRNKGLFGELLVYFRLKRGLPKDYLILNNVYLPLLDGTTTQIDHIVVSQFGIFVVETKCYSGWIFGDANSFEWTQALYRKKNRFQNPMRQNYRHICALSNNLGIDKSYFIGVVALTGDCVFKSDMPDGVVYSRKAVKFMLGFKKPLIKASQVKEIADAIIEWQATLTREDKSKHVENLKKRHSAVVADASPLCPYCGSEMVLRTRKKDAKQFFGCVNYPKCRGVVNVED